MTRHLLGPSSLRVPVALLALVAVLAAACTDGTSPSFAPESGVASGVANGTALGSDSGDGRSEVGRLVVVLPPADALAPSEQSRIRALVERVLEEVAPAGSRPEIVAPMTTDAVQGAIESAVRRADAVCVTGNGGRGALVATLDLYPARTGCVLPLPDEVGLRVEDVDLDRVGRTLGESARAAAGEGTVLVLDGGDAMLDRRWAQGVLAGAPGAQHVVTNASQAVDLLDAQAEALRAGLVPGSFAASGGRADGPLGSPAESDMIPVALLLPVVEAVVLDASPAAAELLPVLLERGVLVVAPRSLLLDQAEHPAVVLRWRVRWDVPLTYLLRRILDRDAPRGAGPAAEELIALEPGPAAVGG